MLTEEKRKKEQHIIGQMIGLYCKKRHKVKEELCPKCEALKKYAFERIEKCSCMDTKTFCSSCRVHCYRPQMREDIRQVMRFSGPRMLLYHPIMTISHGIETWKSRKRMQKFVTGAEKTKR